MQQEIKYSQVQQTPNPEAQDPALVPPKLKNNKCKKKLKIFCL